MFSRSGIKYIQSLQHKKFRDEYGAFMAEGPKVVNELLSSRKFECKNIYATSEWMNETAQILVSEYADIITEVKDFELEKMATYVTANNVIAEFKKKEDVKLPLLTGKISLMLDDIRDPGNFGTIIRTADWFGINCILCSLNTVDMYNPKVVQSTMASLGRVDIIYTDLNKILKDTPVKSYAAVLNGTPLNEMGKIKEGIVIIGNESRGIRDELVHLADEKVTIRRIGEAESLNAAIAAAIFINHFT